MTFCSPDISFKVARVTLDSYLQKTQNSVKKDIAHSMKSVFKSPVAH